MGKYLVTILIALILLSGCGQRRPMTAQDVLDAFAVAGLSVSHSAPLAASAVPIPGCTERMLFAIPASPQRGGIVVVCATPKDGDKAFLTLFHAMGEPPYRHRLYQSHDGRIVVQITGTLDSTTAARYEQVVKSLP